VRKVVAVGVKKNACAMIVSHIFDTSLDVTLRYVRVPQYTHVDVQKDKTSKPYLGFISVLHQKYALCHKFALYNTTKYKMVNVYLSIMIDINSHVLVPSEMSKPIKIYVVYR